MFDKFVQEFAITDIKDNKKRILSDKFRIKYYNIDKIKEASYNELNDEIRWIKYISAKSREERMEVAKGDKLLMEMNDWIDKYIKDEKTKEYYGKWAEWIAEQKGVKKGIKKNNMVIAKKMKEEDLSLELISKITGLSIEEKEKI